MRAQFFRLVVEVRRGNPGSGLGALGGSAATVACFGFRPLAKQEQTPSAPRRAPEQRQGQKGKTGREERSGNQDAGCIGVSSLFGRPGKAKCYTPEGYSSRLPWTKSNLHPVVIGIERNRAWVPIGRNPSDDAEAEPKGGADPGTMSAPTAPAARLTPEAGVRYRISIRPLPPVNRPPSTGSVWPVIQAASLDARKATAPATSSGSPTRPSGYNGLRRSAPPS